MGTFTRVVTVQGPAQLLNALAVLEKEDTLRPGVECHDYLVIHGLFTSLDAAITAALHELARVRQWAAVVNLTHLEPGIHAGAATSERIRQQIGIRSADVIYASRNWQPTNEALLRAFESAEKVLYGDGLGFADSYLWPEFVSFDRAELCLPIEAEFGLLDRIPMRVVPREHLFSVIDRFVASSPNFSVHVQDLAEWTDGKALLLLATSGTESGWTSDVDTEVALYVEHVLRYAAPGQKVVIKPHPRESLGQSERTRQALMDLGVSARVVDDSLAAIPVEVVCRDLRFANVLSLISISGLHLKHLYGMDCQIADKAITLPKIRARHRREVEYELEELLTMIWRLDEWDGTSIFHRRGEASKEDRRLYSQAVDLICAREYQQALLLFKRLRAHGCKLPQIKFGRAAALLGAGHALRGLLALWPLRAVYAGPVSRLAGRSSLARRARTVLRRGRGVMQLWRTRHGRVGSIAVYDIRKETDGAVSPIESGR